MQQLHIQEQHPQQVWPLLYIYRTTEIIGVLYSIALRQHQQSYNKYSNKQAQRQQYTAAQGRRTEEGESCREMTSRITTPTQIKSALGILNNFTYLTLHKKGYVKP